MVMRIIVSGSAVVYSNYAKRLRSENIPFVVRFYGFNRSSKHEVNIDYGPLHTTRLLLIRDRDFAVARLLATEVNFQIVA